MHTPDYRLVACLAGLPVDPHPAHRVVLGGIHPDPAAGAVVGDLLDKPLAKGGLERNRYSASAVLLVLIVACILVFPQRPARRAH